jgi:hypothetical protein
MANIGTNPCKCRKCGHEWLSHSVTPKACSSCGSALWNTDRIYRGETLEEKFWARVSKTDKCWIWTGWIDDSGYGRIGIKKGKTGLFAHRISFEIHHGIIPEGMCVCHRCDNRQCTNPNHLFLGTLCGERHGNAKLKWETICEARRLWNTGLYSCAKVARMTGIGRGNIYWILKRGSWKDSGHVSNLSSIK